MSNATYIQREADARAKDELDARALLDAAAEEKRDLSPEEEARFDRFITSADERKARIAKLQKLDEDSAVVAEVRARIGDVIDTASGAPSHVALNSDQQIMANVRAIVAGHKMGNEPAELAFESKIDLEKRAIADFSDAGALYTTEFSTRVAAYQRTVSPWINLATVINADNGRPLNLPNMTADPTSYSPGEGTAITEATPTIGSAALTTTAYKALSYISAEAEEDELVGLLQLIAMTQGRSIGQKFGSDLTAAIVTAATNGGTASGLGGASTATYLGYEDLLDLKYGAAVPYRSAGVWVMANSAIKKARKFRDTVGQYLWQPAVAIGQPDLFDGNAVFEDPYLATVASASKSVLFGDVSSVVIKQMPLRIATSGEYRFNTDQVALRTVYRAGGALPDALAIRYLISANS